MELRVEDYLYCIDCGLNQKSFLNIVPLATKVIL